MRKFYIGLAVFISLLSLPAAFGSMSDARQLSFYHTHTQQALEITYYRDGAYQPDALEHLEHFLSDWRNGKTREIDAELMDILWDIQQLSGHEDVFEVISAYRSPETNEKLRDRSSGVASNSQHVHGKAIDVRLRGFDTRQLRDTAQQLKRGGVGYYAQSDFVHVDTGRVRTW